MPETISEKFIVDLCPRKPNKLVMELGETRVQVLVGVAAKSKPASIVFRRLIDKAAKPVVDNYQKIIQEEVNRLEAKFLDMVKKRNTKDAAKLANETTLSVQNACKSLQAAVTDAVQKQIKADYRDDANLIEAQVKVAVKIGFTVIKVGKNVATLAVTAGADVTAWAGLAKNIYDLANTINDEAKDEKARRKDLLDAIGKYSTEKQRRVILEQKAAKSDKKKLELAYKNIFQSIKSEGVKAEAKRKHYKSKSTAMRQDLEKLSKKTDEMEKAMKAAPTLKEGVKVGAQVMKMKGSVKTCYTSLQNAEKFVDDMAMLLTEAGVKVDDSTFVERLKKLQAVPDLMAFAKDLQGAAKDLQSIVSTIAAAA